MMTKKVVKKEEETYLFKRENGLPTLNESKEEKINAFCEEYKAFLDHGKTERECVSEAIRLAEKAGFVPFEADKKYAPGDKVYASNRGKALILAVIGKRRVPQWGGHHSGPY